MAFLSARQVFSNPIDFLAYGFGAGLSPWAPGTMGTLVAIPIYVLLMWAGTWYFLAGLTFVLATGIPICGYTARKIGVDDPKSVVWDEVGGYLITMLLLPFSWVWIVAGLLLFRLFDIWKPWPIGWVDRNVKGGLGIMLDDVIAAVFACILLNICAHFVHV